MRRTLAVIGWALLLTGIALASCRATADLGETMWTLVAYGPVDAPLPAEAPASIYFENNGRMGGHDGCNGFFGNYEAEDGRLTFRDNEMAFNTQDCDPASPEGRQDAFFREWLNDGANYTQTTEQLILYFDGGGQVAEYRLDGE